MSDRDFVIRPMTRDDVDVAVDWAATEGWNPGLHDAECFFATDPDGFFAAEVDGKVVGTVSAVAYDASFGFIGLFIVESEHRGARVGVDLARTAVDYLGDRNMGVDGVVAKQSQYEHQFGLKTAYRNIRFEGVGVDAATEPPAGVSIARLADVSLEDLTAYDAGMFPARRPQFLEPWISRPETVALGAIREGSLVGYGVLRKCRVGFKIGPLFADNAEIAEMLFTHLTSTQPGEKVYLDVAEPNAAGVALAKRHKMTQVFETARMYTAAPPKIDLSRIFGITSMELG